MGCAGKHWVLKPLGHYGNIRGKRRHEIGVVWIHLKMKVIWNNPEFVFCCLRWCLRNYGWVESPSALWNCYSVWFIQIYMMIFGVGFKNRRDSGGLLWIGEARGIGMLRNHSKSSLLFLPHSKFGDPDSMISHSRVKRKFLGQVRIPDSDLYNLFEAVFKNLVESRVDQPLFCDFQVYHREIKEDPGLK